MRGVSDEPGPERPGEVGIRHGAVPVFAGEVRCGIVGGFGQQGGFGVNVPDPVSDQPGHLPVEVGGAQPAGHVADVDPPAIQVEGRLEPAGDG